VIQFVGGPIEQHIAINPFKVKSMPISAQRQRRQPKKCQMCDTVHSPAGKSHCVTCGKQVCNTAVSRVDGNLCHLKKSSYGDTVVCGSVIPITPLTRSTITFKKKR
jgi:hypothetical protein